MKGCPYLHVAGRELIKGAHGTSLLEPHVPGPVALMLTHGGTEIVRTFHVGNCTWIYTLIMPCGHAGAALLNLLPLFRVCLP